MFLPTKRLRQAITALVATTMLVLPGCLNDSPLAPLSRPVRLQLHVLLGVTPPEEPWTVEISVYYVRNNESSVDLTPSQARIELPRGTSVTHPVSVDISSCLADEQRSRGEDDPDTCRLYVELRLLDAEDEVISQQTHSTAVSSPGEVVQLEEFVLNVGELYFESSFEEFLVFSGSQSLPGRRYTQIYATSSYPQGTLTPTIEYLSSGGWLTAGFDIEGVFYIQPTTAALALPIGTYEAVVTVASDRGFAPAQLFVRYRVVID